MAIIPPKENTLAIKIYMLFIQSKVQREAGLLKWMERKNGIQETSYRMFNEQQKNLDHMNHWNEVLKTIWQKYEGH